jgi:hypothetical protein
LVVVDGEQMTSADDEDETENGCCGRKHVNEVAAVVVVGGDGSASVEFRALRHRFRWTAIGGGSDIRKGTR